MFFIGFNLIYKAPVNVSKFHFAVKFSSDELIILPKMRVVTIISIALTLVTALYLRCCEGTALRRLPLPDDDEEYRPRPRYRDYGLMRSRVVRTDDSFDDYGHLRFGRSED